MSETHVACAKPLSRIHSETPRVFLGIVPAKFEENDGIHFSLVLKYITFW